MMLPQPLRNIVNGEMIGQYINQKVSVYGMVTNVNPNGTSFDLRTVDDCTIKINLRTPYRDLLQGSVEVHGMAMSKTTIMCDEFIQFPQESELDYAGHNKLCLLLSQVPDLWATS